jgi:uncharacterized membrane protein
MTTIAKTRIESIDLLKGVVMVIMALDHVRDYFHYSAFMFNPADPTQSTLPIFLTRWITHFCAPAFSFLAGLSAFMVGKRKSKNELSVFLIKRGIWLIFIELTIVCFGWYFDLQFRTLGLLVIWSLGISMIILAALIYLPRNYILLISLLLICFHNLLDNVHFPGNVLWSVVHEQMIYKFSGNKILLIGYPIVPWFAVMALGYYFGSLYDKSFDNSKRKKLLNSIGIIAVATFVVLRLANLYGDPKQFKEFGSFSQNLISFLNPNKYPPSLLYLLMTLGATFLFLANSEKLKGRIVNFFCTFGRVPFFYYILHIYIIHIIAMIMAQISGWGWKKMILSTFIAFEPNMKGYGYSLWIVYVIWISAILLLYPLCKRFDKYKQNHKEKWWLSYL